MLQPLSQSRSRVFHPSAEAISLAIVPTSRALEFKETVSSHYERTGNILRVFHHGVDDDEPSLRRLVAGSLEKMAAVNSPLCEQTASLRFVLVPLRVLCWQPCLVMVQVDCGRVTTHDSCEDIHLPYCPPHATPLFILLPLNRIGQDVFPCTARVNKMQIQLIRTPYAKPEVPPRSSTGPLWQQPMSDKGQSL